MQCRLCRRWRQIPAQNTVSATDIQTFSCASIFKFSCSPCSLPEDERVQLILDDPHNFLASLKLPGLCQSNPLAYLTPPYPPDLLGLSPVNPHIAAESGDLTKSAEGKTAKEHQATYARAFSFPAYRRPFAMPDEFPPPPGSWSPVDISTWERRNFPQITRYPALYLALRNTVLFLWNEDPKRLVTGDLVQSRLIIRGLLRVLLIEQWLPHLLAELTCLGMINIGVCAASVDPAANTVDRLATQGISSPSPQTARSVMKHTVPFCVHVIGSCDLRDAVLAAQIRNFLALTQRRCHYDGLPAAEEGKERLKTVSPHVILLTSPDPNTSATAYSLLDEVSIPIVSDPVISGCPQQHGDLSVPRSRWSDRVNGSINNETATLAFQANLSMHVEPPVCLFSQTEHGLVSVDRSLADRMEFHVEALFDQVVFGESPVTHLENSSVQAAWDSLNKLLRLQLPDLKDDEMEHQLTEFFLANIEMRVIEALLMNQVSQGVRIPMRFTDLTQLSPQDAYTVLLLRQRADLDSPHSADIEVLDFDTHDACALLQVIYSDPSLILTDASRRPINASTRLRSAISESLGVTTNSREVPLGLAVTLPCSRGSTPSTDAGILVKTSTGQVTQANSVVVTLPASSLKILFCDNPEAELRSHDLPQRNRKITSCQPLLSLYLPHQFRLAVADFSPLQPHGRLNTQSDDKITRTGKVNEDQGARTITVTLVYPRPWWRERLAESLRSFADSDRSRWIVDEPKPEPQAGIGGQILVPELFGILPRSRNERGFCHTFQDLKPQSTEDDSVGLLQTQLFGSAVEKWWDAGEQEIAHEVHCHLSRSLCSEGGEPESPNLLTFSVSKWALDASTTTDDLEPQLEVISKDDLLVDARVPVLISPKPRRTDVRDSLEGFSSETEVGDVELSFLPAAQGEFFVSAAWWQMLSDVAGVHVLSCLDPALSSSSPDGCNVRRDVSDPLSNEVATGLDLAQLALSRPPFRKGCTHGDDIAFEKWSSRQLIQKRLQQAAETLLDEEGSPPGDGTLLSDHSFSTSLCSPDYRTGTTSDARTVGLDATGAPPELMQTEPSGRSLRYLKRRRSLDPTS
uniref:CW-type domain-containing protein n=1 Tax=Schistocephalus solidus TaxID=70667 RepID=A0A0X3QHW0_SCHSO